MINNDTWYIYIYLRLCIKICGITSWTVYKIRLNDFDRANLVIKYQKQPFLQSYICLDKNSKSLNLKHNPLFAQSPLDIVTSRGANLEG